MLMFNQNGPEICRHSNNRGLGFSFAQVHEHWLLLLAPSAWIVVAAYLAYACYPLAMHDRCFSVVCVPRVWVYLVYCTCCLRAMHDRW